MWPASYPLDFLLLALVGHFSFSDQKLSLKFSDASWELKKSRSR